MSWSYVLVALFATQASPFAGTWFTEFDARVEVVNGVESVTKGHARLDFTVQGDSIHGTWQNLDTAGTASGPARQLAGAVTNTGARIETLTPTEMVRMSMSGETRTQAIMNYVVKVHGDSLVGTVQWVAVDHSSQGPARGFTATRTR